jgi:hypothetical protein
MLPATLQERLAKYLAHDKASATIEATGFPFISTKAAQFRFEDAPLPNPLNVIILGAMRTNTYYEGDYEADNPTPPTCFALNLNDDEAIMGPPPDLPGRIHDTCLTCGMNAFGSGGQSGKGKACRNVLRLAVLPWDGTENFAKVSGARLSIPPTSLKKWAPYAKGVIEGYGRPLFMVVTTIKVSPDPKYQMTFDFDVLQTIDDTDEDLIADLMHRVETDGLASLETIPAMDAEPAESQRPARGGAKKRVAVKKKAAKKASKKKAAKR